MDHRHLRNGVREDVAFKSSRYAGSPDDEIARRAIGVLAWNAQVPSDGVKISVSEGWATLGGAVNWNLQRTVADAAVRELPGVVGVFSRSELAEQARRDDIRQRIIGALSRHARLDAGRIGIAVDGATVTVSGTADNWDERFAIQRAVWSVCGVRDVVDQLQVA